MNTSAKKKKGIILMFIGILFSNASFLVISTSEDSRYLPVVLSFIGIIIIVYGLIVLIKATQKNG